MDLGPVTTYIGINIVSDRRSRRLFLDQTPYVHSILDEFKMSNCTPLAIPMDPKENWTTTTENTPLPPKEIKVYQRLIGKLMYLMLASRPVITYATTKLAQFASSPTKRHWLGVM